MSILLRPYGIPSVYALKLTTIAAVAVAEAIEAVSGKNAMIKWVNDVYVNGRKVCGILTEASFNIEDNTLDYAVVGIGVNVYEPEGGFPDNIRDIAGAVSSYHKESSDQASAEADPIMKNGGRNRLAAEIIVRFYKYCIAELNSLSHGNNQQEIRRYFEEYRRRCFVIGREVDVLAAGSAPVRAYVTGLDDECGLKVIFEGGHTKTLRSGEISIRV